METALHVLERFFLHFVSGAFVYLLAFAALEWARRKYALPWPRSWWALILPGLIAFLVISSREIWDVAQNPALWWKSIFDWASWMLGLGAVVYGIYRLTPSFYRILREIQEEQHAKRMENLRNSR